MIWYPLKLSHHVRTYAFGDRLIPEKLGKVGVPEGAVAETWEVSDYKETTATVQNGHLQGKTLCEVVTAHPSALVGEGWRGPHFPLLAKFLDASRRLPIHLHADGETARRKYGEPNGKSEAWHILWAAPGASILAGIKPGLNRQNLSEAFKAQAYDEVMPRFPIKGGDTVYVPGGTLHTFGPDTLVFEVQQTSDLGQTVMPTGLYGNPLLEATWEANIREVLDELRTHYQPEPNPGLTIEEGENLRIIGCAGPHFALERWKLNGPRREPSHPRRCLVLTNVGESVRLEHAGGAEQLGRAESCVLPAAIGEVRVVPQNRSDLIACYVPDLEQDIIQPLRTAGYGPDEIGRLGEVWASREAR